MAVGEALRVATFDVFVSVDAVLISWIDREQKKGRSDVCTGCPAAHFTFFHKQFVGFF